MGNVCFFESRAIYLGARQVKIIGFEIIFYMALFGYGLFLFMVMVSLFVKCPWEKLSFVNCVFDKMSAYLNEPNLTFPFPKLTSLFLTEPYFS